MKVLVLGGTGHIGKRLLETLACTSWDIPTGASRRPTEPSLQGTEWIRVDTCNVDELTEVLRGFDAVVNCVAGNARSISEGTQTLVEAAMRADCRRIIHLSTMSVYGPMEGIAHENSPLDPGLGWYGRAKCEAERCIGEFVRRGGEAVVLRPGCVFGAGSELWVGRVGRWLKSGRLGDLGNGGDGWSNLVHVDDVCEAVMAALQLPISPGEMPTFNLAAPDSPRWNDYFVDLALSLGATPVARIGRRQLLLDAWLAGPPLKLVQKALSYTSWTPSGLADPMPPGLLRLWSQHLRLDATQATQKLGLDWTTYTDGLRNSSGWLLGKGTCTPVMGNTVFMH